MKHYMCPIAIEKEAKQDDLPGVYGVAASIDEAKSSILEAIRLYILQCKKTGALSLLRELFIPKLSLSRSNECHLLANFCAFVTSAVTKKFVKLGLT
jgi:hypothetical protein